MKQYGSSMCGESYNCLNPWTLRNTYPKEKPRDKVTHEGERWKREKASTLCLHFTRLWEGLGAVGEGDDRGWDGWMASRTRWTWVWVNSRRWWWTDREAWRAAIHGVAKSRTRLSDWSEWVREKHLTFVNSWKLSKGKKYKQPKYSAVV